MVLFSGLILILKRTVKGHCSHLTHFFFHTNNFSVLNQHVESSALFHGYVIDSSM